MGRPDVSRPVEGPEFVRFLRLMEEHPNVVSKVTCPKRLSKSGPPHYANVVPFAWFLAKRFPNRMVWGTDWPHPNMTSHMPDDQTLVDIVPLIAPTSALRQPPRRQPSAYIGLTVRRRAWRRSGTVALDQSAQIMTHHKQHSHLQAFPRILRRRRACRSYWLHPPRRRCPIPLPEQAALLAQCHLIAVPL